MKPSFNEMLAQFFREHPGQWVDGRRLHFAGSYAWRTRISNIRKSPYGMVIENRIVRMPYGGVQSEYRYVPKEKE
jgi:hypothetical protein